MLTYLDELSIPFTHNQAEQGLRMVKVQLKIAGTFRREEGVTACYRIRSSLSTMRKRHAGGTGCDLCWSAIAHRFGTAD